MLYVEKIEKRPNLCYGLTNQRAIYHRDECWPSELYVPIVKNMNPLADRRHFDKLNRYIFTTDRSFAEKFSTKIHTDHVIICPIAIAYSIRQIIKSFCVCACVRACVCPAVDTLTVAFFRRFLPNLTQTCKPPKVKTSSLGVNIAPPLPLFSL